MSSYVDFTANDSLTSSKFNDGSPRFASRNGDAGDGDDDDGDAAVIVWVACVLVLPVRFHAESDRLVAACVTVCGRGADNVGDTCNGTITALTLLTGRVAHTAARTRAAVRI
jgi:hypothetical protein